MGPADARQLTPTPMMLAPKTKTDKVSPSRTDAMDASRPSGFMARLYARLIEGAESMT